MVGLGNFKFGVYTGIDAFVLSGLVVYYLTGYLGGLFNSSGLVGVYVVGELECYFAYS